MSAMSRMRVGAVVSGAFGVVFVFAFEPFRCR